MGGEPQKSSRKRRADSARNHDRLLEAARQVFYVGGPGASLEAVARQAGVGIATLYRHFPTREALCVYRGEVDQLVELAAALTGEGDPVDALRRWMHASVRLVAMKRGMLAALAPALEGSPEVFAETSARLIRAVSDLMAPGIASGRVRGDVSAEEVMRAFLGICYTREASAWQDTVIRLLDVFVDGLATGGRGAGR